VSPRIHPFWLSRRLHDRLSRPPAIRRAFAAHLAAELAMLMAVPLALGRALVAGAGAKLAHLTQDLSVFAGLPKSDVGCRIANVGAIDAQTDALHHVEVLGEARVRTAAAHLRAIHH